MARAAKSVILFSRVTVDDKTAQWPVATFSDHDAAKTYATLIKMAHANGDVKTAKALDSKTAVDGKDKLIPGMRFSIVEVPNQPSPSLGDGDLFGEEETPTS